MDEITKSAAADLVDIYWRHHAKWDMPPSLKGKQAADEDLLQLANDTCLMIDGLLIEVAVVCSSEEMPLKTKIKGQREARRRGKLWAERENLLSRVRTAMAELNGDEWYYFWGLHQILEILPQTMEEK